MQTVQQLPPEAVQYVSEVIFGDGTDNRRNNLRQNGEDPREARRRRREERWGLTRLHVNLATHQPSHPPVRNMHTCHGCKSEGRNGRTIVSLVRLNCLSPCSYGGSRLRQREQGEDYQDEVSQP